MFVSCFAQFAKHVNVQEAGEKRANNRMGMTATFKREMKGKKRKSKKKENEISY